MEAVENVITLKPAKRKTEKPDSIEKSYREANAPENGLLETYRTAEKLSESDNCELDNCLFVDLLADEKGRKSAIALIKSDQGRSIVVNAVTTNGLDKSKVVMGLTAVMRQYHSGHIVRIRALCEEIATEETPRKFLESSIIPMLVEIGIIIRPGERSAYWQPHNLMGKTPSLIDLCKRLFELTPAQRELKQLADQLYAEQQKLNALSKREMTMQQQKAAYMRITTQSQQLAEMAVQNPTQATLWDKARANPGATLMLATLAAGVLMAALGSAPSTVSDAPMPTVSAAMQPPAPTPDTAAVAALETAQIRQQMEAAQ